MAEKKALPARFEDMDQVDEWLLKDYYGDPTIRVLTDDLSFPTLTYHMQSMKGGKGLTYTAGMKRARCIHIAVNEEELKASQVSRA
jgi:hypothetical protein